MYYIPSYYLTMEKDVLFNVAPVTPGSSGSGMFPRVEVKKPDWWNDVERLGGIPYWRGWRENEKEYLRNELKRIFGTIVV